MGWLKTNWILVTAAVFVFGIGGWVARSEDGHSDKEKRITNIEKYVDADIKQRDNKKAVEDYRLKQCKMGKLAKSECR